MNKFKLKRISEVSKILELSDPKTKEPLNHTLRYWEKEFKIIRPKRLIIVDIIPQIKLK